MRLEGDPDTPRLVGIGTGIDLTDRMAAFCEAKIRELEAEGLCGFVFKRNSPSCGLFGVEVHPGATGTGLFAAAVARHFPQLPLEEEGGLHDPAIRKTFIERVFSYGSRLDDPAERPPQG
jgi:uncharacterized protein YbbK (DUF523 family)